MSPYINCSQHHHQHYEYEFEHTPGNSEGQGSLVCLKQQVAKSWISCVPACTLRCFSHVWFFATLWTIAGQAPLSRLSRQEYWRGFPCPSPGIFPTQGLNLCLFTSVSCIGKCVLYDEHHLGSPRHNLATK